ncbi:MAG: small ribosomal subunit Rsm22 family protein [Bdellovibrionales bacterium]|nr:small ribosomal subunit Rsm22 family protein [Bdellovibrionales bacterium]
MKRSLKNIPLQKNTVQSKLQKNAKTNSRATSSTVLDPQILVAWKKAIQKFSRLSPEVLAKKSGKHNEYDSGLWRKILQSHSQKLSELWWTYTQERRDLKRLPLNTAAWVGPYLMGFHLPNIARNLMILERAGLRGLVEPHFISVKNGNKDSRGEVLKPESTLPLQKPVSVRHIDIGAGAGACSLALWSYFKKRKVNVLWGWELIDRSRPLLQAAQGMLEDVDPHSKVQTLFGSLHEFKTKNILMKHLEKPSQLNIISMSYLWNEIQSNPSLVLELLRYLKKWGQSKAPAWLLISEPAAEFSARSAQLLREELIDQGWLVKYPCPGLNKPCPMLATQVDWCYSEFTMKQPTEMIEVDQFLGITRNHLGVSGYLLVNRAAEGFCTPSVGKVLVGKPRLNHRVEAGLLCDGEALHKISPLEKGLFRGLIVSNQKHTVNIK